MPQTLEKKTRKIKPPSERLFIGGKRRAALSGKTFPTENPATREIIAHVAEGDAPDIDLAVQAARQAFGAWRKTPARERAKLLFKAADLLEKHAEDLARLETLDAGKPISDTRAIDLPGAADCFRYYAGWANKLCGETIPVSGDYFNYTLREPVGVVGAITPWNFPLVLAAGKIAPALACGCTVVLKPAEQTPLTALRLAELMSEAGIPEGVVNVVPDFGPSAGAALVRHPGVDHISFTGEYVTGQEIMRNAADTLKRVSLELGGKSPNIVFADADLERAARAATDAAFFNAGQVCCAGTRLFVEKKIQGEFTEALLSHTKKLRQGDPLDPATEIGPQISEEQLSKVLRYIDLGKKEGARLLLGGTRPDLPGHYVTPAIFDRATNTMRISREEIFGPVVSEIAFRDAEEAVRLANDSFYGLAAAVWTRDITRATKIAGALEAGTVWINCFGAFDNASPFGGYKMSGFGREGGRHALELYTEVKSVWIDVSGGKSHE